MKTLREAGIILPATLGLACANACFNVTLNDSALHFPDALAANAPLFAAIAAWALLIVVLARQARALSPLAVRRGIWWCLIAQMVAAGGLGALELAQAGGTVGRLLLVSLMFVASLGALAFWLRCGLGASARTSALIVFLAVLISEPIICLPVLIPPVATYVVLTGCVLVQVGCLLAVSAANTASKAPSDAEAPPQPSRANARRSAASPGAEGAEAFVGGFFSLAKTLADDRRLLAVTAAGIWIISLATAVIRVFPDGTPIPYTPMTLTIYFALTMVVAAVLLRFALDRVGSTMTTGIWLVMQGLALLAILACGLAPDRRDIGLSFTYVLDVLLLAYVWYTALAFMDFGRHDPYYYVGGGLIAYLLPRALTNVVMPKIFSESPHALATIAIAAALIILCAQFVFLQFAHLLHLARVADARGDASRSTIGRMAQRALGLEEPADTSTVMRLAIMQVHANRMKEQFLLSERETEVLTLYALGYTQERIAAELFLAPGTVHTYMKRIYGKTNLHSRQEILDYIERYPA